MSAIEKWLLNGSAFVVTASGVAYLWMKYALESADPFALVNHPWQPAMLHLHVLGAPVFILAFGIVFQSHIARRLQSSCRLNRLSGWLALATFAAMAASGYLLQVLTATAWLRAALVVHLASSGLFVAAYATHLVVGLRLARAWADRHEPAGAPVPAP